MFSLKKIPEKLFSGNTRSKDIEALNQAAFAATQEFRERLAAGKASRSDMPVLKQKYPAFGVFPIKAAGIDFVMFHAHDDLVVWEYLWFGEDGYESNLVRTWASWCRKPGLVLDIGGYSGLMSILAARAHPKNQVHLFEPLERVIERANINIKLNGISPRVTRHAVAASDCDGEATINLYRDEDFLGTGSSLTEKAGKTVTVTKRIRTVRIDTYLPDIAPSVVKIDVEGHELATLDGMDATLRRARPHILIEVWENTREDVLRRLHDMGYSLTRSEGRDLPVNNFLAEP